MRTYTFYLYDDDGELLGSSSQALASDTDARAQTREMFRAFPECEEIEVWEAPRYVAPARRIWDDVPGLSPPGATGLAVRERARVH